MSYYVKVGDETTEIPECCDECYMRQNRFEICESCSLLDQYNGGYFSLGNLVPKKEYYCAADCNRIIHDISKKPEWCPILKEEKDEKNWFRKRNRKKIQRGPRI